MNEQIDRMPTSHDVRELVDREAPIASLFVPITAKVPERSQNPVRLERAVDAATERLRALGQEDSFAKRAREDLSRWLSTASPSHGVAARAAFWSPGGGGVFFGLPFACDEHVAVASTPVLRPLLRAARRPERYRLLVLSGNRVELFEGDASGLERMPAEELPSSLEDALGGQLSEASLQYHSSGGRGDRPVYHGQGGASRGRDVDFERFHQHVGHALEALLAGHPRPLVLASEARHRPALEAALHRDVGLLAEGLDGNPDHLSAVALHERAWPIVTASVSDPREELERARDAGPELLSELSEIVRQSVMGTLARLWVPERGRIPGRVDVEKACASPGEGDDDLVDSLAAQVVRRGGEVLVLAGEDLADDPLAIVAEKR